MEKFWKYFWLVLRILFGLFMINAGVQHFVKPDFYIPFVPSFLPFTMAIIYVSGVVEVVIGLMMLIPKYAKLGAFGLFLLMIAFLPIHIWDIFADNPAIGSQNAAYIRLPVQFLFIALAWKLRDTAPA